MITRKNSTKAERRVYELLKKHHIPFRFKNKINGREVDFIIGKYAVEIDGHKQDGFKNEMLAKEGYTPIHIENNEINKCLLLITPMVFPATDSL